MKRARTGFLSIVLSLVMLAALALPGTAFAAGEPNPPKSVTAETGKAGGRVTLSIVEPDTLGVDNVSILRYEITILAPGGGVHGTVSPGYVGATTTHSIDTLTDGMEYTFQVKTIVTGDVKSAASTDVKATPSAPAPAATAPGAPGLDVSAGNGYILVKLTAPSNPGTGTSLRYNIQVKRSGSVVYNNDVTYATEYYVTGLSNGVTYTVEAYAINSAGNSPVASKTVTPTATSQTAPGEPGVTLTAGSGYIDVNITKPASIGNGASGVTYYITAKQGNYTYYYSTGNTGAYRVSGLTNGVACTVEVYALNNYGLSSAVVTKTATPGANATYNIVSQTSTYTGSGSAVFVIDAPLSAFSAFKINGTTLARGTHYVAEADGSRTRVTVYSTYLNALANGTHTVNAVFTGGVCNTTFNVNKTVAPTPVPTPPPSAKGNYVVTATTLNVRSAASTGASIIGWLTKNTLVTVEQIIGNWGKITMANGLSGWVSMSYLKTSSGTVITPPGPIGYYITTGSVNMRMGPGTNYKSVGVLSKGARVSVISFTGNWAYATVGSRNVYISRTYLR